MLKTSKCTTRAAIILSIYTTYWAADTRSCTNSATAGLLRSGSLGFLKENRYVALKILVADAPDKDLKILTYLRNHGVNHPNIMSLQDVFTI